MQQDSRYIRFRQAIEKLSIQEIKRFLDYPKDMVYDGYNFEPYAKRY